MKQVSYWQLVNFCHLNTFFFQSIQKIDISVCYGPENSVDLVICVALAIEWFHKEKLWDWHWHEFQMGCFRTRISCLQRYYWMNLEKRLFLYHKDSLVSDPGRHHDLICYDMSNVYNTGSNLSKIWTYLLMQWHMFCKKATLILILKKCWLTNLWRNCCAKS